MASLKQQLAEIAEYEKKLSRGGLSDMERSVTEDVLGNLRLCVALRRRLSEFPSFARWPGGTPTLRDTPTVAFFYVDRAEPHPLHEQSGGAPLDVDYAAIVKLAAKSVRDTNPQSEIVILTDEKTAVPEISGAQVIRKPVDTQKVIRSRIVAYRDFAESRDGPIAFLDPDLFLQGSLSIIDRSFDVALTYRTKLAFSLMPINCGVILVSNSKAAVEFFNRWIILWDFIYERPEVRGEFGEGWANWYSEQIAVASLFRWNVPPEYPETRNIDGLRLRLLPVEKFNYKPSPKDTAESLRDKWAIHLKGNMKASLKSV